MKKVVQLFGLAVLVGSMAFAGILGPASGTVPFGFGGTTDSGGPLTPTTMFTVTGASVDTPSSGSFLCDPGNLANESCMGWQATLVSGTFTGDNLLGQVLTFAGGPTGTTMQYEYTVGTTLAPTITPVTSLVTFYNIFTTGTFTDLRGAAGFNSAQASLGITIVQTCTSPGNCSDATSAAFSTPPAFGTPEPASFALIGSALLGIGFIRRRRKA